MPVYPAFSQALYALGPGRDHREGRLITRTLRFAPAALSSEGT